MSFHTQAVDYKEESVKSHTDFIVSSIMDWSTARLHDGHNISPLDWGRLSSVLHYGLKQSIPGLWIRDSMFEDLDTILLHTRNLTMLHMIATQIVHSHLHAYRSGDPRMMDEVSKSLKARAHYVQRHSAEVAVGRAEYHIAQMIAGGDPVLERKRAHVDLTRARDAGLKLL